MMKKLRKHWILVNVMNDCFKKYIRSNNQLKKPYKAFFINLNRGTPIPSFNISLDGTFSDVTRHIDSDVCFCYNDDDCVFFAENHILCTIQTSNPPDGNHENNWNYKKVENKSNTYVTLVFGYNPFLKEGTHKIKTTDCTLLLDVRDSIVHIDLMSYIGKINSYHLQGIIKLIK